MSIDLGRTKCVLYSNTWVKRIGGGTTSGGVVTLKTGKQEEPDSNPGRTCQPSCLEFCMVFSKTRINTG